MEPWLIALILKPVVFGLLVMLVLAPIRNRIYKWRESKLKRLLLWRIQ